jgi:hypothetical protein
MASLAAVVSSIVGVVTRTNANLVRDLERESETLDRLRDSFSRILANGTLSVWSFVEELAMPGADKVCPFVRRWFAQYSLFYHQVVAGDSAIIGDARENHGTIRADHVGMTKFSTREDDGYEKILDVIVTSLEDQPS